MGMASKAKIKTLDGWFSKFIRLRDTNKQGYGNCYSCGKLVFWKEAHAGHYLGRENFGVRWYESNVHLQCVHCNTFQEGNKGPYLLKLISEYGKDIDARLRLQARLKSRWCDFELVQITKYYRLEVKRILKERGL